MLRLLKKIAWLVLLLAGLPDARRFVLFGPVNEAYQVRDNGFNIAERGDIGAPKNLGEEYRRNIPIMYYSYNQAFLDFYGAEGVAAVDAAFAILNNLNPVSSYSPDLSEFPTEARRQNYRASAVGLVDLKSFALSTMLEQLGVTDPIRYIFDVHNRAAAATCPEGNEYLVTMRNFDIIPSALDQLQYSYYINGVQYTYYINEFCANPPFGFGLSQTVPQPVDGALLIDDRFLPVASAAGTGIFSIGLNDGFFFTGLTRDDMAGLRYLYRAGNVNWESLPAGGNAYVTNNSPTGLSLLVTSNLTDLAASSLTNTDAALLALYPNLVISGTTPFFTTIVSSNQNFYFTNYPWSPAGVSTIASNWTYSTNIVLAYRRSFLNVVTNYANIPTGFRFPNNYVFNTAQPLTQGAVTIIDTNISTTASTDPYGQPGATSLQTNITTSSVLTNMVMGDFFIVPTNSCGYVLLSNVLTVVLYNTNTIFTSNVTTTTTSTNTSTNFSFFSRTYITSWTNHNFAYFPIDCITNQVMLRRGVEKITFLRRDFDSLLGQFFYPQTNLLAMTTVTNSRDVIEYVQRVATAPDFLFTAADLVPGPAANPARYFISRRSIAFNQANVLNGLAGPGTIEPGTTITFNKSGPIFFNTAPTNNTPWSLDDLTKSQLEMWASFDDSTNAPTLYPNGTSIGTLENQLLLQLVPTTLPTGQVGVQYSTSFSGGGGQPPYTFNLAPNSAGLPPGLNLSFDGSGQVFGTPSVDGIYDFIIRMTDSNARFADWQVTVTINP